MIKRVLISPDIILGNKTNAKQNSKWQCCDLFVMENIGINIDTNTLPDWHDKIIAPPYGLVYKPTSASGLISPSPLQGIGEYSGKAIYKN